MNDGAPPVISETVTWQVPPEAAGQRLDRHVSEHLGQPRNQVQQWIRQGLVRLDGEPVQRPSHPVEAGAALECRVPQRRTDEDMVPEEGRLQLLYEDEHLVALDKPAGLAVHPGAGQLEGTLAHRLLAHYPEMGEVGGPGRPGIVHRLDRGTTGVLIVARTPAAYQALTTAFAERQVDKRYLALVYGIPREPHGRIDGPIGRHPQRRKEMTIRASGRPALSLYRTLATVPGLALLEIELKTGRTHQIRVHLKSIGHPLVGDEVYGERRWKGLPATRQRPLRDFPRPALHAWRLRLAHPLTGEPLQLEAPVPDDLRALWQEVGGTWPEG